MESLGHRLSSHKHLECMLNSWPGSEGTCAPIGFQVGTQLDNICTLVHLCSWHPGHMPCFALGLVCFCLNPYNISNTFCPHTSFFISLKVELKEVKELKILTALEGAIAFSTLLSPTTIKRKYSQEWLEILTYSYECIKFYRVMRTSPNFQHNLKIFSSYCGRRVKDVKGYCTF